MTSPTSAGSVSVEVLADAKALARDMKRKVEESFRGLDVRGAIDRAVGRADVRVPVAADVDSVGLAARLQAAVSAAAARAKATVKAEIEVDRDGGGLSRIAGMFRSIKSALPDVSGLTGQFADLSGAIQRSAGSSAQLGGSLVGALSTAAGPAGIIIGLLTVAAAAMAALAAAAVAAVPAITAVAGAAAAIPGALVGAGAAFGTLALGFKGISEAFKDTPGGGGGGGGGAVNQARQVAAAARQVEAARRGIAAANRQVEASERALAAAQRGLVDAQRRLVEAQQRAAAAQKTINAARRQAVEDIDDLNRSLRGARLSEEEAALGVTEALRDLEAARLTGNLADIQRAELAYRRAQHALEDAADTADDLQQETDAANKAGVEGSKAVQDAYAEQRDALAAVRDAQNGVLDATDGLKSAQDGVKSALDGVKSAADGLKSAQDALAQSQQKVAAGGGGVAAQVTKLAPAAQRFVNAIKALKPAFEDLRLDVQEKLFAGLDKTVTRLGRAWIPALETTLGAYAKTFNRFFKDLGKSLTEESFIRNIQSAAEAFRTGFLAPILDAVSQKLVPAFGQLAKASAPFIRALGEGLAKVVTKFSDWVAAGEKSGGLRDFFERAAQALKEIGRIGGTVFAIIGSIFEIITGAQSKRSGQSPLEQFRRGLEKIADWLDDPKNQAKITAFLDDVENAIAQALHLGNRIAGLYNRVRAMFGDDSESLGADLAAGLITGFLAGLAAQGNLVFAATGWLFSTAVDMVKDLLGIKSPSTVFTSIGKDVVRGFVTGIGGMLGSLRSRAASMRTTVVNAVSTAGSWLVSTGRNAVYGLGSGISGVASWLRSRAISLRTTVTNALSNAGNWLVTTGRNVVYGLWNGIVSLGSWLYNRIMSWARANIPGPIARILGIASPSKLMAQYGRWTVEGFAGGMDDRAGEVEAAAQRVAAAALPAFADAQFGLGVDADAAISRSLAVADQRALEARWADGATGDKVLDALRGLIQFRYRGDVSAALGSR